MQLSSLARNGLILFDSVRDLVDDSRMLRSEVARGNLVSLRRGAFVEAEHWASLSLRCRHLLRIRAVLAVHTGQCLLAGPSAAAVWGMPIAGAWPADVTLLGPWKGGGRSEPGVRKTSSGYLTAISQSVDSFRVTTLARTALDVARTSSFADALGSVDWSLWRKNEVRITADQLFAELARFGPRTGKNHLHRIAGAATDLSDSFGESQCRATIRLLGFEEPELQVAFRDSEGEIIPDYYWRSIRHAAEFDGKVKYTRVEFTNGDPAEVVWKEKKREDRLRRLVSGVSRILTHDVAYPARLEALLLAAGVPRRG